MLTPRTRGDKYPLRGCSTGTPLNVGEVAALVPLRNASLELSRIAVCAYPAHVWCNSTIRRPANKMVYDHLLCLDGTPLDDSSFSPAHPHVSRRTRCRSRIATPVTALV